MLTPDRILRRLRSLLNSRRESHELDEELRFHIDMEVEQRMREGLSRPAAQQAALAQFGGGHHRDAARDASGVRPVEDFIQDLRIGVRTIFRQRTYAIVAVLTLAIGIGATTALWSAVYRVLLQPLPFPDANRIVTLQQRDTRNPTQVSQVAPGNFLSFKEQSRAFDLLAAAEPYSFDWISPEGPQRFDVALVTKDFFPLQGLRPLIGRVFLPEEFGAGRNNVVVITETLFRTQFGSDTSLIGSTLVLDSMPRVIAGVVSKDQLQPFGADMFAPKVFQPDELNSRSSAYWQVAGRLAPGMTMERAQADVQRVAAALAQEFPTTNKNTTALLTGLREAISGSGRRSLLVLMASVAFVLLIACVNVANLQLAESLRRQREFAIRAAIGAGQGRIVRQLLTESLIIATAGAAAGLAVAYWGIGVIRVFAPSDLWLLQQLTFDTPAIACASVLALLATVAVGLMPVITARRIRLADSLAAGARTGVGGRRSRHANRILVVAEVALALVLMVGAGLLLRSLSSLLRVDRGYDTNGIMVVEMQLWSYYPTPALRAAFVRQATERLEQLPGVERAATTSSLPLSWPIGLERTRVSVEGQVVAPTDELPLARTAATSPGYFDALRIPLRQGRSFSATDLEGSQRVAIINETFARRYFGDASPIGKHVTLGFMGPPVPREIVGVVGDVRHEGLQAQPGPSVFLPHAQASTGATNLVLRVSGDPALHERAVRSALASMNGAMPLNQLTTLNARLSETLRQRRFQLGLLAAFSITALLLSAIGIYGVMSRITSERTHEIGVRMAVGADRSAVRAMVLRSGGTLAVTGIGVGLAMAVALTRAMSGMLYDVKPLDPLTYAGSAMLLLVVALVACWVPAWRASTVDPVIALRHE